MRLANPEATIDALDLSVANLRRARLHCLLHRCSGVSFHAGDLLDPALLPGPYHFIDAFGVLHHQEEPARGMRALADRLVPGGVLRVMVYGRYARRESESIRRALNILGISSLGDAKRLFGKARRGGQVREFLDRSSEALTDSGLADLFLNPVVHTFRMDDFLEQAEDSGLQPLLFAHHGALANPECEIERFREQDRLRESMTNIICYLVKAANGPGKPETNAFLRLNPLLEDAVSWFRFGNTTPADRLGRDNPPINPQTRRFLRRFRNPVPVERLSAAEQETAKMFLDAMFLLWYRNF
jgi:SAM-dependent methyltransferase